jgi:hypothetical protein
MLAGNRASTRSFSQSPVRDTALQWIVKSWHGSSPLIFR